MAQIVKVFPDNSKIDMTSLSIALHLPCKISAIQILARDSDGFYIKKFKTKHHQRVMGQQVYSQKKFPLEKHLTLFFFQCGYISGVDFIKVGRMA
jgi:hypothetical protein